MTGLLRPDNAGSNTATDHITTTKMALAQLPKRYQRGRRTLIRTDSAGGTHDFLTWLTTRGRWLSYSARVTITDAIHHAVLQVPNPAWTLWRSNRVAWQHIRFEEAQVVVGLRGGDEGPADDLDEFGPRDVCYRGACGPGRLLGKLLHVAASVVAGEVGGHVDFSSTAWTRWMRDCWSRS